ncbi:ATP-binding cassette transporter snq2, partial [Elasticomyces elasticus]
AAYDCFDKVVVLYEGRGIFFGRTDKAQQLFVDTCFERPERQTIADSLTSMTSAEQRVVRAGFENRVPRMPDEFAEVWKNSEARRQLLLEIDEYDRVHKIGGENLQKFVASRRAQ